jgi:hypothetical protein
MTRFVRCIDNTLVADVLTVGSIYEVLQVKECDGYHVLPFGRFTMARFRPASRGRVRLAPTSWAR